MNRISHFLIAILIISIFGVNAQSQNPDWENSAIFEKNQVKPHARLIPFSTKLEAIKNDISNNSNYQSLNGEWKFKWVETPEQVPENFWQPKFNSENWDNIIVPSNWQMEGFGYPKFRNIALTFKSNPPFIPDDFNPTGCYLREFNLSRNWDDNEIFLRFEGIKSASYVWVNGKEVGYNQGGFEPAEYNITPFLKKGGNTIAVKVLRYSDGSYLENQDMWRLSGIYRDVYIYATPKVHIQDYYVVTNLDQNYNNANLELEFEIQNKNNQVISNYSIEVDVLDIKNNSVWNSTEKINNISISENSSKLIEFKKQIYSPRKWSAEKPNLYKLVFSLNDENGKIIESFSKRIGFREVELIDNVICINGIPVKFNAVNSHMHHPDHGQAIPLETLKKDLVLMKQFNINAVRTSHYPPSPEYLDFADELGVYVFDETDDECHANTYLSENPEWEAMYADRATKMVYRDRNHPSVVIWSAGNEAGSGNNVKTVIETGKKIDPSRPLWMYGGNTFYIPFEDIIGPRYWIPLEVKNIAENKILEIDDQRPSFMDEYIAATGNGLGGLDDYWEIIYKYPRISGGAIWDWISPGVNFPVIETPDNSSNGNTGYIMGRPTFSEGKKGKAIDLSGHDDWIEFYRDPSLDITGNQITIEFWINPRELDNPNTIITKSDHQYGIIRNQSGELEFYLHNRRRASTTCRVPDDWYNNWHHVAGIYNGEKMMLYIDYEKQSETPFNRKIQHSPFPLCIGRNAETQDQGEYSGQLSNMKIDEVRIYNQALSIDEIKNQSDVEADQKTVLSVSFEETKTNGEFFSTGLGGRTYGIIWPDREIQPEIWQIKKSAQPVKVVDENILEGKVKIINRFMFTNLNELKTSWELYEDYSLIQSSNLKISLNPQTEIIVDIPFKKPEIKEGKEYSIKITFTQPDRTVWSEKDHIVAWDQIQIPYEISEEIYQNTNSNVSISEFDKAILISGKDFVYQFSKVDGSIASLKFKGTELIKSGPKFNIWRAPLANDIDPWGANNFNKNNYTPGMGRSIDNQIYTLGLVELQTEVDHIKTQKLTSGEAEIKIHSYSYSTNRNSAFEKIERYVVSGNGEISLEQEIIPHGPMPDLLPKVGLQFQLPEKFDNIEWYGRGSFETYPDRKTGAQIGLYSSTVKNEYVPYLFPQDYGNKTDIRWVKIADDNGVGLEIKGEKPLNFSAHNFTTENLSRAVYPFQLKEADHTILNVDFEVTGVGGTARRTLTKYRVTPGIKKNKITIKPIE